MSNDINIIFKKKWADLCGENAHKNKNQIDYVLFDVFVVVFVHVKEN